MDKEGSGNNVIEFERFSKPKREIGVAIDEVLKIARESIGTDEMAEFKIATELYRVLLNFFAGHYAKEQNDTYEQGISGYDSKNKIMVIGFGPFSDFNAFLVFLKSKAMLIPENLKRQLTVYVYEHDNAADSPGCKIDQNGFELVPNTSTFPDHDESFLPYDQTNVPPHEAEFRKLADIRSELSQRLRAISIK